ncbi:MAG: hypothetical protein MUF21_10975 [Gemmatimonadaceae bacterium]|jgi:hypothetical protein|nr:hypothetical protein [Gemmatimonadaceae bacterium]
MIDDVPHPARPSSRTPGVHRVPRVRRLACAVATAAALTACDDDGATGVSARTPVVLGVDALPVPPSLRDAQLDVTTSYFHAARQQWVESARRRQAIPSANVWWRESVEPCLRDGGAQRDSTFGRMPAFRCRLRLDVRVVRGATTVDWLRFEVPYSVAPGDTVYGGSLALSASSRLDVSASPLGLGGVTRLAPNDTLRVRANSQHVLRVSLFDADAGGFLGLRPVVWRGPQAGVVLGNAEWDQLFVALTVGSVSGTYPIDVAMGVFSQRIFVRVEP